MAEFVCSGGNDKQRKDSQNISGTVREESRRFSTPACFCQCVGTTVFCFTFTLLSRNTNEREDAPMRQRILVPGVEWKFKDRNRCQIQINEIAIPYHNDDDVLSSTWSIRNSGTLSKQNRTHSVCLANCTAARTRLRTSTRPNHQG